MEGRIAANWFDVLSVGGIIGSLLFTAVSLRTSTKTRRVGNLLALTENHREIWSQLFEHPDLARVLDANADVSTQPVSLTEKYFVTMIIQHLSSGYEAMRNGLAIRPAGIVGDVQWFFSLPIPQEVWRKMKPLQNKDFVEFVENARGVTAAEQSKIDSPSKPHA